jgi:hypothetical protein
VVNEIEDAIVSRLSTELGSIDVRAFPSSAEEYKKLPLNKSRILVAYAGSSFSEPTNRDQIIQEQLLEFEVTIQVRNLREHDGAYTILESVYSALNGYSPCSNSRVLFAVSEKLTGYDSNVWTWIQTWQIRERRAE